MDNDNVYQPRGGYYPSEPVAQATERDEEIAKTLHATPRIKEAIERLDARIAHYETTKAINVEMLFEEKQLAIQMLANVQTVANLEIERDWFIGLIHEATKE